MIPIEERKEILDDEVEGLTERGWTVISRTDTTCLLKKEDKAMGVLSGLASFLTLFPFYEERFKTRSIEINPEGEVIRSWLQL